MEVIEQPKIDLLPLNEPALSTTSDMPLIETKPDSQPEAKVETKPDTKPAAKVEPKAKEPEVAAPVEGKKPEESAPLDTPEPDPAASDAPKKAQGVQKRIDELTSNWREAERRAESERQEKLRLLALVEKGGKPEERPVVNEDPEPQRPAREAFGTIDEYVAALADYADAKSSWSSRHAVADALAAEKQKVEQGQIEEGQKQARDAYAKRVEKATEEFPDYKAVAESPDVLVSVPMAHAILHSEHGPKIAYHLGKNPEEAKRISLLSPPVQLMEMGLLVARISAPAAKAEPAPAPQQKPAVSAAPKPIKPLETKGDQAEKTPENMSTEEYIEYARKRDAASKRSGARF